MVVLSDRAIDKFIMTCKPATYTFAGVPAIDLNSPDAKSLIVKACEEFGFFKVVNHGLPLEIMNKLQEEAVKFFDLPPHVKEKAGNASPFGYGNKKIGRNGDVGWIEYLLIYSSPEFISKICHSIFPDNPEPLSKAMQRYIKGVKGMAAQVLEMMADGLGVEERGVFSRLIMDEKSDSSFRVNHYPPCPDMEQRVQVTDKNLVGFGEHTDPQIISVLHANDTAGFQICLTDGTWVTVPPDNTAFFFNVGDTLQVLTNARFKSVKHRVFADYTKPRLSMIFFGGPPLNEKIIALPSIMQQGEECLYKEFTWWEYKNAAYKTRLNYNRLERFIKVKKNCP